MNPFQMPCQALGTREGCFSPTSDWPSGWHTMPVSGPQGLVARTRKAKRESSLVRWAASSRETPTYPVPGERLVACTHIFRHIF